MSEGLTAREAVNGTEALADLAAGTAPDVILLDIRMPGADGWRYCARSGIGISAMRQSSWSAPMRTASGRSR
jgi:DNA-binding response OmpR family regulator